ncbi:MAG: HAD family hydrolase [Firmicutes bacterium]|nr:HAD family hydrolase [Bacillota bacterium]
MIKAVLFDLGKTLCVQDVKSMIFKKAIVKEVSDFLQEQGYKVSPLKFSLASFLVYQRLRTQAKKTGRESKAAELIGIVLADLGIPRPDLAGQVVDVFYEMILPMITPFPGVPDTLAALKKAGYKIGLVSNGIYSTEFVRAVLRQMEVLDYFDTVIVSSDFGLRKPRPEIFLAACRVLAAAPEETAFIGDSVKKDILGAKQVGMLAILFDPKNAKKRASLADHAIREISEVEKLLPACLAG